MTREALVRGAPLPWMPGGGPEHGHAERHRPAHHAQRFGRGILANSLDPNNTFSTVQSATNSTSNIASAVIGSTTGAAWGVSGQVDAAATAESAVYGSNLRTNGGHGVLGIGFNGVVGRRTKAPGTRCTRRTSTPSRPGQRHRRGRFGLLGRGGRDRYLGSEAGAYGVLANGEPGRHGAQRASSSTIRWIRPTAS